MNERIMGDYFIKPLNDQLKLGVPLSSSLRNSLGSRNLFNQNNISKTLNDISKMNRN